MRKRYLIIFILLLIIPVSVFALDDINNNLLGISKKKLTEVVDISEEKKLSKTDGLGGNSSFKSIAATNDYLVVARGNGTLMFLDKNTYSVIKEEKYSLSSSASIAYDSDSNNLIASKGEGQYIVISLDSFSEISSISLTGEHIAFSNKFNRYYTYDGNNGVVYSDKKSVENNFTLEVRETKNDISYNSGYVYLVTHNTTGDKLFGVIENDGNVIYIFDQRGKHKKTYYITNEKKVGNNNLVSITVSDSRAYLLYESGEIYSSSALGNLNVAAVEPGFFKGNKFINVVRNTFFSLDYYIYTSIVWVIQGLFDIAKLRSYTDIVSNVRNKLYVILGVIMLFRLTLTFIRYLINPDDLVDRFKGSKRLIFKTLSMFVLLLMIPSIFEFAYRVQYTFIPIVPKLVLGENEEQIEKDIDKISNDLAVVVLSPFFHPNYTNKSQEFASIDGSKDITSLDDFAKHMNDVSPFGKDGKNPGYSYEYRYLLSSIVGMITLFLLVGITVSAGTRFFKLLVLEMLAPIPVLLNISPYRDEDNPLIEWLKEVGITFVDLFIKIGLMYMILYLASEIKNNDLFITWESAEGTGITPLRLLYLKSFLIVGLLICVYLSPKYLNKLFGLDKQNGSFLGSVTSGIVGFGSGLVSGLTSGVGVRGSLKEAVDKYHNYANKQLNNAWGVISSETELDANRQKGKVNDLFQEKVNKSIADIQKSKTSLDGRKVDSSKERMETAVIAAQESENKYREVIESGQLEGESAEDYNKRRTSAYSEWQNKSKVAAITEKDYSSDKALYDKTASSKRYKSHKTSNVSLKEEVETTKVAMTEVNVSTINETNNLN